MSTSDIAVPSPLRGGKNRVERNQVSLRFLIFAFMLRMGRTIGALPQAPAGNLVPCTLSPLRGGFNRSFWKSSQRGFTFFP